MKRVIFGSVAVLSLVGPVSCGSDAEAPSGSGGRPVTTGGAPSGVGGSATGATGGTGTGGTGTGGTGAAAGMAQAGGSSTTGGSSAGGAPPGGSGGTDAAGTPGSGATAGMPPASGGSAGNAAGTGGDTGSGGAPGGGMGGSGGMNTAGTGGSAGSGVSGSGAGGGSGDLISTVAKTWDGALVTFPCGNSGTGYDCANLGCTNNMVTKTTMWTLGGDSATVYEVTLNVKGILEAYAYDGGTREAGNASISTNRNLFQRGGKAQSAGGANYDYNVYELDVAPAVTGEPNVYFLNSVTTSEGPHAPNTPTSHLTFDIDDKATIKVMGGGTVTLKLFDSNCTLVQNCGPTSGNTCSAPRTVQLGAATPPPPTSFMQPFQMPSGKYGQWVFFDITNVVVAQ